MYSEITIIWVVRSSPAVTHKHDSLHKARCNNFNIHNICTRYLHLADLPPQQDWKVWAHFAGVICCSGDDGKSRCYEHCSWLGSRWTTVETQQQKSDKLEEKK